MWIYFEPVIKYEEGSELQHVMGGWGGQVKFIPRFSHVEVRGGGGGEGDNKFWGSFSRKT